LCPNPPVLPKAQLRLSHPPEFLSRRLAIISHPTLDFGQGIVDQCRT